jgi:hypothetical protein
MVKLVSMPINAIWTRFLYLVFNLVRGTMILYSGKAKDITYLVLLEIYLQSCVPIAKREPVDYSKN